MRLLCPWDSPGRDTGVGIVIPFSRGSSQPRNWTHISCIAGRFFTVWAREAPIEQLFLVFQTWHVQFQFGPSVVSDSLPPPGLQHAKPLSITNFRSPLKLMSIESVMPFNHLILCHTLLLPSIFCSIRLFSSESVLPIRWPKYWSFSFSISPFNEYSELISFRTDWFDLLVVQGTLKNLLQHHSSKASISSMLSFLYGPALTSRHDYWKNHCFD